MRRAKINELDTLNQIAYESEGIWGEDDSYMELFSQHYKVTQEMIEKDFVYIMEEKSSIVGFFAILNKQDTAELELFYISKSYIGMGYGTRLWENMIEICRSNDIGKITLVGSKDVGNFYKRLGAREIEKIESSLKVGRIVSRYQYDIE